jgi:2,3-bisphosphoglycerate-dependent phosphoglycerate mutase
MVKLVLIRHGQSVWNQLELFTGYVDIPLSAVGEEQATAAGAKLQHIHFDVAFTSTLFRAQQTLNIITKATHRIPVFHHTEQVLSQREHFPYTAVHLPVHVSERINERYYGALQGLNKKETATKYGEEQVKVWRRSYDVAPPHGESLKQVTQRTIPFFVQHVLPFIQQGNNVLISAHGNSLRSIIMHLDMLLPHEVAELELATGVPICYELNTDGIVLKKEILI